MGQHGGKREGAGRKQLKAAGPLSKGLAAKLRADPTTEKRWRELREEKDPWLRLAVEKYIWDRDEGKPLQYVATPAEKSLEINVRIREVGS